MSLMPHTHQEEAVNAAFSRQSASFDDLDASNPILQWMRERIRRHMLGLMKPGDSMLELNAGTGLDAVYFAGKGFRVHATDNAPGMVELMEKKTGLLMLQGKLTVQRCSFNQLGGVGQKSFDHIFSNFGGLNCAEDLNSVIYQFEKLLNPGGTATLVIMPPICLWEMASLLKGNFKMAFRRFRKRGASSHLEGVQFKTYYYSPRQLKRFFGKGYEVIGLEGLGITAPPPYKEDFAKSNPRFFRCLTQTESVLAKSFPFYGWGDHFMISVRKRTPAQAL